MPHAPLVLSATTEALRPSHVPDFYTNTEFDKVFYTGRKFWSDSEYDSRSDSELLIQLVDLALLDAKVETLQEEQKAVKSARVRRTIARLHRLIIPLFFLAVGSAIWLVDAAPVWMVVLCLVAIVYWAMFFIVVPNIIFRHFQRDGKKTVTLEGFMWDETSGAN